MNSLRRWRERLLSCLVGCRYLLLLSFALPADALEPVTLQLKWTHSFQFAGYYAAKAKGYYQAAGLDVTIREAMPGLDIADEVSRGRANYGTGSSSLILARHAGQPVVTLAVIFQHSPYILLAPYRGETQSLHDLLGKRLMLEPGAEELLAYLKSEGIPLERLQRQAHSLDFNDLIRGKTDAISAYSTTEPYFLDRARFPYQVYSPRAAGIDFYGDNLFTSEHELRRHPERARGFRDASLRGWEYALAHPDEIIDLILASYPQRHDREHLRFEVEAMRPLIRNDLVALGYMNPGRWRHIADTYASIGMLPADWPLDDFLHADTPDTGHLRALRWTLAGSLAGLVALSAQLLYILRNNRRLNEITRKARQTENQLRTLSTAVEQSPTSIVITGPDNRIEYVNPRFTEATGYSVDEVLGRNPSMFSSGLTDRSAYLDLWLNLKQGRTWSGEFINRRKSGELYWEEAHISPVLDENDRIYQHVAVKLDITERKRAENQQLTRARVLELLAQGAPLPDILEAIIRDVETGNPEVRCSIMLLDAAGQRLMTGAAPSLPQDYSSLVDGLVIGPTAGSCGTAAYTRQRCIAENIQTHPFWNAEFRAAAAKARLAACWSEPIRSANGSILGSFAIYHARPRKPGASDLQLLAQGAHLAAIAIDRSRAQEALRRSEQHYRLLADNLADVIWTVGLDGRLNYVSPAIERLSGYSVAEALNLAILDILNPGTCTASQTRFQALIHGLDAEAPSADFRGELEIIRKDGTFIWVDVAASSRHDDDGRCIGLLGVSRDITERKTAEQMLRLTQFSIEQSPDAFYWIRPDGHFVYVNDATSKMLGYSREELLTLSATDIDPLFNAEQWREHWEDLRQRQHILLESIHKTRDGRRIPVEISANLIIYEGREYNCAISRDITARLAAKAAIEQLNTELEARVEERTAELMRRTGELVESEERFRLAMEASSDGLWDYRPDAGEFYCNPAYLRMLGFEPGDIENTFESLFTRRLHPSDRARVTQQMAELFMESGQYETEFRMRTATGEQRWILGRGKVVKHDDNGKPVRAIGTHQDITERKHAEQAIRELNASLEQKVAKRTAELAAASAAKSQFLAHMSHEIRTPMNAILGMAQLLAQESLATEQRELVQHIREAGGSLLHIINDILDFSKIEAGRMSLEKKPFEVEAVLTRLRNLMTVPAESRNIAFIANPPETRVGPVLGDALRLEQILINLSSNAVKFTERGHIRVQVAPVALTPAHARLRFTVADTGIGIAPETMPRLFQPFTQADTSITRRFGGTGLGLAICRRLVDLMGGEIGVDSTPGEGCTFWFELPFQRFTQNPAMQPADTASADQDQPSRLDGLRVLVVDDNAMNRLLVERALKLQGAATQSATNGQEALDTLTANPTDFDAVLMDIQMPVMDGLTATRALREDETFDHLPVIALTAGVLPEEREAALNAGVNDFLTKPVDLGQLVAALSPYRPTAA